MAAKSKRQKIGLVIRPGIDEAVLLGREVVRWAKANSLEVLADEESTDALPSGSAVPAATEALAAHGGPIVTLGGDGTLLRVARYISRHDCVVIGVNFGKLGFLTEIAPGELFDVLEGVIAGRAKLGQRTMLLSEVLRKSRKIFSSQTLNEAVVQKGARAKLLELDVTVDDEEVMRLRADGILISTPTGSTAYSLAAGGSIVYPSLPVMLLTPICPHSLSIRPLVLPMDSDLHITVPEYDGDVSITVDGQASIDLQHGDVVKVTKAPNMLTFARSPSRSYFEILRTKLNWGIANSSE